MSAFSDETRLATWRRLVQIGAGLVFLLSISLSLAGIPARRLELIGNQDNFSPLVSGSFVVSFNLGLEILLAGIFLASGVVIATYRSRDLLALFLAASLAALGATETGMSDAFINAQYNPDGVAWRNAVYALRSFAMGAGLILLYIFPDGQFAPRWTCPLAYAWGVLNVLWFFFPTLPFNPNDGPTWRATPVASLVFGISWFGSGIAAQILRGRRTSDPIKQQQVKWSVYGLSAAVLGGALFYGYSALKEPFVFLVDGSVMGTIYVIVRPTLKVIGMSLLPVCLGVAILRYRLFDIDLLISRTMVYSLLTGLTIGVYLLVASLASGFVKSDNNLFASLFAAGVVAVLFQPLRERLQHSINRMFYGDRDDPYRLLSSLGQKLEGTFAPQATLSAIVETIGRGLKLPYVAIATQNEDGWRLDAEFRASQPSAKPESMPIYYLTREMVENWPGIVVPINYQGHQTGVLLLSQRAAGETLTRSDLRILEDLARQTGLVVHSMLLQKNLQLARQRLVNAREEERLRLRRDLHDGLGPTLASLTLQVDAARNLVRRDPQQAEKLLEGIACQTQEIIDDIRRLVYGLRPPALDELGLIPALKARAEQQAGLQINFQVSEDLTDLPAALEVAVYRIVTEAITNVARHAHARRCQVTIAEGDNRISVQIEDDGQGLPERVVSGAGLQSMRERVVELGGIFSIQTTPGKGVCIQACLPLGELPDPPVDSTSLGER